MFNLVNGLEKMGLVRDFVNRSENQGHVATLRGNGIRTHRESFPVQIRNDFAAAVSARYVFFSNRVVPHWNRMPENVVRSKSTADFKAPSDKFNGIGCYSTTLPNGCDGLIHSTC